MVQLQTVRAVAFPLTVFLSAFLLFQVQPIMGRYALPWFGGTPSVWTNCLLFFQAALLLGYLYAHLIGSRLSMRTQAIVHPVLLLGSLAFLPIVPSTLWRSSGGSPSIAILGMLGTTVGAPYVLLSATAPLVQRWFTLAEPDASPWRLYALSNFGSFLALLSYPFLVEPFVRLNMQARVWSGLYVGFVISCAMVARRSGSLKSAAEREAVDSDAPSMITILFWLALAAAGSTLLMASTNEITQEVAVSPFLWIAPLSVYLLTFVLTFESDRWYKRPLFAVFAGVAAPAAGAVTAIAAGVPLWTQIGIHLLALFATCMLCHGELARARPSPCYLTTFYLSVAGGGVAGGVFTAIVAPRVFTDFTEYPVGLSAACVLGFLGWIRSGALAQWTSRNIGVRVSLMALLLGSVSAIMTTTGFVPPQAVVRNFYGILRVRDSEDANGRLRQLTHGRTKHGFQYFDRPKHLWPTSYYGPSSGVGLVLTAMQEPNRQIAVIGLGTGTIAAWGRTGDTFRFYEINPDVESIAQSWFTFLKDSKAKTEVVLGDARIQLERELESGPRPVFDVIAADAFSSDAIPMHLLTVEAVEIYAAHLKPGGVLLFHISSRTLQLEPVVRALADHLKWKAVLFQNAQDLKTGEDSARWIAITANSEFFEREELKKAAWGWTFSAPPPILWTDDFASLLHVLKR